jgi:hypothetical protein
MREWVVLAERVRGHRVRTGENVRAVVTVRWRVVDPSPGDHPTPDLGGADDYGPVYARHGLFDLMRLEGHSRDYRRLVADLARVLVQGDRIPLRPLPAAEARELFPRAGAFTRTRADVLASSGRVPPVEAVALPAAVRPQTTHPRPGRGSAARPGWITARHNPRRPLLWGPGGDVEEQ